VARLRADGTADARTEELVPTSHVIEIKTTYVVPTGQRGTVTLPADLRKSLAIEEDTPLLITEEDGWFAVRPLSPPAVTVAVARLEELMDRATPENLHGEVSTGEAVGRESW
jgi:antitoxin MazE